MKSLQLTSLLALGLVTLAALPAHAVTPFSENFSATPLNASRWSLTKEGGLLKPSNGKLLYSVTTVGSDSLSYIMLRGIQPGYNESWEVTVNAVNSTRSRTDNWTSIGVAVLNAADPDDIVGLEIASGDQNAIYSDFKTNGVESADVEKKISSSKASLRVTFSSVTKIITLWYRTSPAAAWTKHANFSTTNSTSAKYRGNWRMKANGKFTVALYGSSDGDKVPAGQMSLDNFVVRNLK